MKPESLRVHAPSTILFLCGGAIDPSITPPKMLRDAFFRIVSTTVPKYKIVRAEDASPLTTEAGYSDLFSFESDIAQLVGLILLFAESAGSLAELGAFAALKAVAPSLLAVLDDYFYNQISFIRNGPVRFLENEYGEEWILVLDRKEVGIADDGSNAGLIIRAFSSSIFPAVEKRLANLKTWTKFDPTQSGHAILLMIGLCQELGALTIGEIKHFLDQFGCIEPRINNYLYCAQLLGWVQKIRKGNNIFYVGVPADSALDYALDIAATSKLRWRSDIREYWRKMEPPRFRAISEVISAAASAL